MVYAVVTKVASTVHAHVEQRELVLSVAYTTRIKRRTYPDPGGGGGGGKFPGIRFDLHKLSVQCARVEILSLVFGM